MTNNTSKLDTLRDWQYKLSEILFEATHDIILPKINWKEETFNGPDIQLEIYKKIEPLIKSLLSESEAQHQEDYQLGVKDGQFEAMTMLKKDHNNQLEEIATQCEKLPFKNHTCRFNDGEQKCDCFLQGRLSASNIVRGYKEDK